jgi:ubiquinone/menaquinone biosynthesis C-methylase UbiE
MNQNKIDSDLFMVDGKFCNREEVRRIFNNGEIDFKKLSYRHTFALNAIQKLLPIDKLMDAGCYAGTFLKALKIRVPSINAVGVDYYHDNIRIARLLYPELKDQFKEQSIYQLEFESSTFDCVTCFEVIEHLDRPIDAIRELNRVLRPSGYLIISTPNATSLQNLFSSIAMGYRNISKRISKIGNQVFFNNVEWNRHIIEFLPLSLNTILILNGFELIQHRFITEGHRRSIIERLIPGLSEVQIFIVKKTGDPPKNII